MPTDLDRFAAACVYPGKLDEQAVERELATFLRALSVRRRIVRLQAGLRPEDDPPLRRNIEWILAECVSRNLRVRRVSALRRAVLALRAARRLRATLGGDADFAFDVLHVRVGGNARAALDARHASAAGAADTALAVLDGRAYEFPVAYLYAFFAAFCVVAVVARLAAPAILLILPGWARDTALYASFFLLCALFFLGSLWAAAAGLVSPAVAWTRAGRALAAFAASPARALRTNLRGSTWELSWTACALFGAVERRRPAVEAWLRPLFEAFVCGCWLLYWTDETLYWVAKPTVHREPSTQRLHHDTHAALESDIANLYFWHGVMVPRFVILRPDLITIAHIDRETNAEVRRVMIERYRHGEEIHGAAAFIHDAGGVRLDHDERYGTLWRRNIPGDEPIVMIEVVNRTREPDGSFKRYWLRVPPGMRIAREAVAWTFNMPAEQYAPGTET